MGGGTKLSGWRRNQVQAVRCGAEISTGLMDLFEFELWIVTGRALVDEEFLRRRVGCGPDGCEQAK